MNVEKNMVKEDLEMRNHGSSVTDGQTLLGLTRKDGRREGV